MWFKGNSQEFLCNVFLVSLKKPSWKLRELEKAVDRLLPTFRLVFPRYLWSPKTATLFIDLRSKRQVRGFYRSDFVPHLLFHSRLKLRESRLNVYSETSLYVPLSRRKALMFSLKKKKTFIQRQSRFMDVGYLFTAFFQLPPLCVNWRHCNLFK